MRSDNRFWMGITAGLVLMFGGMQLMQGREPTAHAAPQGVDNQGRFALAVGSSEANRNDLLWVLHEHPPHPDLRPDRGGAVFSKPGMISLCLYKAEKQGEKMKLMAARDIAFDIEFQNLNQDHPDSKTVYEIFREQAAKNANAKK